MRKDADLRENAGKRGVICGNILIRGEAYGSARKSAVTRGNIFMGGLKIMRRKGRFLSVITVAAVLAIMAAMACVALGLFSACGGNGNNGDNGNGGTGGGDKPSGEHTHSFIETVIEPTCTTKGYTLYKCACGEEYKDNEKNELPHNYVDGKCTDCGDEVTETTALRFELSEDKTYYIATELGEETLTRFSVPAAHNGKPVKEIGGNAFYMRKNVVQVVIPESINKIGREAFRGCDSLTGVTIGGSLSEIGEEAFRDCISLVSVKIQESAESIGDGAFINCGLLTKIKLSEGLTSIGKYAFYGCGSLANINIPESVTSIGSRAFASCGSLASISVAGENGSFKSIRDDLYGEDGKTLIQYAIGKTNTSFSVPNGVTSIGEYAFFGSELLTDVTIDGSVTKICDYAFCNSSALKSVRIGGSVTAVGDRAFDGCDSLESVTIDNGLTSIGKYAFDGCGSLANINIPESVTSIGGNAFRYCDKLLAENGVSYVDKWVVGCAVEVKQAELKADTVGISDYAFDSRGSIVSLTIGNKVKHIGNGAFSLCISLTSITLPASVERIGDGAFYRCDSLTGINVSEGNGYYKSIQGNLYTADGKTLVQYAIGKTDTAFVLPESVTNIGNEAFHWCGSLTSITIGNSVKSIGDEAFGGCRSLADINYNGTKAEWAQIEKGAGWTFSERTGNFTVHCTDGDLTREEA